MKDNKLEPFSRRTFLRGTTCALSAAAIGLEVYPPAGEAASPDEFLSTPLSVGYWDGTRLLDARILDAGDLALCKTGVKIVIHGHAGGKSLRAINAYYPVQIDGVTRQVPFHAWTAAPHGNPTVSFSMPVQPEEGILLGVEHGAETLCRLSLNANPEMPRLRTGTYILASGAPHWSSCHIQPEELHEGLPLTRRSLHGLIPVSFDYRIFSVTAA